jgi:hypothetical protein
MNLRDSVRNRMIIKHLKDRVKIQRNTRSRRYVEDRRKDDAWNVSREVTPLLCLLRPRPHLGLSHGAQLLCKSLGGSQRPRRKGCSSQADVCVAPEFCLR